MIDNILSTFKIDRSLSRKGNRYDNAVSEVTNKILKIEFIYQRNFDTLEQRQLKLADHVYWYNNQRIHGSLDYMTPIEYRELNAVKLVKAS